MFETSRCAGVELVTANVSVSSDSLRSCLDKHLRAISRKGTLNPPCLNWSVCLQHPRIPSGVHNMVAANLESLNLIPKLRACLVKKPNVRRKVCICIKIRSFWEKSSKTSLEIWIPSQLLLEQPTECLYVRLYRSPQIYHRSASTDTLYSTPTHGLSRFERSKPGWWAAAMQSWGVQPEISYQGPPPYGPYGPPRLQALGDFGAVWCFDMCWAFQNFKLSEHQKACKGIHPLKVFSFQPLAALAWWFPKIQPKPLLFRLIIIHVDQFWSHPVTSRMAFLSMKVPRPSLSSSAITDDSISLMACGIPQQNAMDYAMGCHKIHDLAKPKNGIYPWYVHK